MEAPKANSEPMLLPEAFDLNVDPPPNIQSLMKPPKSLQKIDLAVQEASELDCDPVVKKFNPDVLLEPDSDVDPGITTIAVAFSGGVVIGADCDLQLEGIPAEKISQIADNIFVCCKGPAAHCWVFSDYVRCVLSQYTLEHPATVKAAASLVHSIAYTNKSKFCVSLILGGWDKYEGGKVYQMPQGGSSITEQPFAAEGPISEYLHGILNKDWKHNMTKHEAEKLLVHSINTAIYANALSFNGITTLIISSEGTSKNSYTTIEEVADLDAASTVTNNKEVPNATTVVTSTGGLEDVDSTLV